MPDSCVDRALAEALPDVDASLQSEFVSLLLERDCEEGLQELPAVFHQLPEAVQCRLIARNARLFGALRNCIRRPVGQTRLNTIQIIRASGNIRLGYLVAAAMTDGSRNIRAEAAATLRELAENHHRGFRETVSLLRDAMGGDGELAPVVMQTLRLLREERRYLTAALLDAIQTFDAHHRLEVLEAGMLIAEELDKGLLATNPTILGKLAHATMDILSREMSARLAPFAYVALCYPELRRRVLGLLATRTDADFFIELIRCHWMTRAPEIHRQLAAVRSMAWLKDAAIVAFSLPPNVAEVAPAWLSALGVPSDLKVAVLRSFLMLDSLPAVRAAVWALIRIDTPVSTQALKQAADHADSEIRRMACHEIRHRGRGAGWTTVSAGAHRPHVWSRVLQKAEMGETFGELWEKFDSLPADEIQTIGEYSTQFIPQFMTAVRTKLLSPQPAERRRAVQLITALHLAGTFRADLFAAANDNDGETRAAVLGALGQVGDDTARRILERAVGDELPSAQAAAIDGLSAMGARSRTDLVLPKAKSENATVRAAALRMLLKSRVGEAASELVLMLHDPRAEHRCAALWLVDQMRISALLPRLEDLIRTDKDMRVVRIAEHVRARLRPVEAEASSPTGAAGAGAKEDRA